MSTWPLYPPVVGQIVVMHTFSFASLGQSTFHATVSSATWPTANLAYYIPFRIPVAVLIDQVFWFNGATVSGNVDAGVYSADGTRLISSGSTAQATINVLQSVNVADTRIDAGWYYLGLAMDNTTATVFRSGLGVAERMKMLGVLQQGTAFPLPATATFAAIAQTNLPVVGFSARATL